MYPPPGSDVVEWLFHHIEGFHDRREARKYASNLLKAGFIRHTVNKITFSEQCYYTFGDLCQSTATSLSVSIMRLHAYGFSNEYEGLVLNPSLCASVFSPIRHGIAQFK